MKIVFILSIFFNIAFGEDLVYKILKNIENIKNISKQTKIIINYDPFFPKIEQKKTKKKAKIHFNIKAILNKETIINGKWRKEGKKIEDFKIIKIKKREVILIKNRKKIILNLKAPSLLKVKELIK